AATPEDTRGLTSTLVDLRSERSRLQTQLDNLEAAGVEVRGMGVVMAAAAPPRRPVSKQDLKAVHRELHGALEDRSMVAATLEFSQSVLTGAKRLRMILAGDETASFPVNRTPNAKKAPKKSRVG
ncbi:MAG TPA: hypothetical protein VNH18_01420, partial [Bryobacteraceae bacterium]|nr:hypothetical protein [Bryobacteraceae bacterium]